MNSTHNRGDSSSVKSYMKEWGPLRGEFRQDQQDQQDKNVVN